MGVLDKIPLDPGEAKIDTWTLLYTPPAGGEFNGKLQITNQRLLYDAKYDMSPAGYVQNHFFVNWGSDGGVVIIPKARITNVEVKKSFFAKKVLITTDDGQLHTFSYGMMNIDPVAAAIHQR